MLRNSVPSAAIVMAHLSGLTPIAVSSGVYLEMFFRLSFANFTYWPQCPN